MKKLLSLFLATFMLLTAVGCSLGMREDDEDSTKTIIRVVNFPGGVGTLWLEDIEKAFEEEYSDVSFEAGKTGVDVKITKLRNISTSTMANDSYMIYFHQKVGDLTSLAMENKLLDITDMVTEKGLDKKVYPEVQESLKLNDKYYGLPHYEIYPGVTYDVNTFKNYKLFLARPTSYDGNNPVYNYGSDVLGTVVEKYTSKYGEAYFTKADAYKSCGPDGVYGTEDDGLPSSLEEMIMVCAKMKNRGVNPFTVSGENLNYGNYLLCGLWTSLAGYDDIQTVYSFKTLEGKTLEIVDYDSDGNPKMTSENVFTGIDYIKKPVTKQITINSAEDAHLVSRMVSKYYAYAFMEIIEREDWWSSDRDNMLASHINAQKNFYFGGVQGFTETGMLVDGNYWYNEANEQGTMTDYLEYEDSAKEVAWMSLPNLVTGTRVGSDNDENIVETTLMDWGNGFSFINANIKNNEGLVKACKEFLAYCYSDYNLKQFTIQTGICRPMSYDLTEEEQSSMSDFNKKVWQTRAKGKTVYFSATPDNKEEFSKISWLAKINLQSTAAFTLYIDAKGYEGYLAALTQNSDLTCVEALKLTTHDETTWKKQL